MELLVKRKLHNEEATLGHLFVDGKFQAHTLEDQPQYGPKIPGETRIPAGRYQVKLRTEGGMYGRYMASSFYRPFFHGHLWLQDVDNFKWIYFHSGNTDDDTGGCILIGTGWREKPRMVLLSSRIAYRRFYNRVFNAVKEETCWVTVEDEEGEVVPQETEPPSIEENFEDE